MTRWVLMAVAALGLHGCALALVAAGAGGGAVGAQYMQPADRTFTAPLEQVHDATERTLSQMQMTVGEDFSTADGRRLMARAGDRSVEINLENVTYNTTRMTVSVTQKNGIEKDHATEQEVLRQTGQLLADAGAGQR